MPDPTASELALDARSFFEDGDADAAQAAALVAIALHLTEPAPVAAPAPAETRQPTGLNRIGDPAAGLDLPPEVSVEAIEWEVTLPGGVSDHFCANDSGVGYIISGGGSAPTLAAAVAAIVERAGR